MTESAGEDVETSRHTAGEKRIPGEVGVWIFVLGDMALFGLLFFSFAWDYGLDRQTFRQGQEKLDQVFGLINTILLLTGSLCVAIALDQARNRRNRIVELMLLAAVACGVIFILNKIVEYSMEIGAGNTMMSDTFFMYYYTLTMVHLMHVVLGTGVLIYLVIRNRRGPCDRDFVGHLESGGAVWHMVDLLWIALFPLLYLIPMAGRGS